MIRFVKTVLLLSALFVAMPTVAEAKPYHWNFRNEVRQPRVSSSQVPELDPGSASAALMLLAGSVMLMRSGRRTSR